MSYEKRKKTICPDCGSVEFDSSIVSHYQALHSKSWGATADDNEPVSRHAQYSDDDFAINENMLAELASDNPRQTPTPKEKPIVYSCPHCSLQDNAETILTHLQESRVKTLASYEIEE